MCGLFGAISPKWDPNVIRTLAICNRERGTDSLGFFDSSGKMIKGARDPMQVLGQENITNWLNDSNNGTPEREASWFVAGHTRLGTRGAANRKNAHPFRYGNIIGSHNGMVAAPFSYDVDSMVLFDTLNTAKGDYQKAWETVSGYWGLSWFDGTTFFLQVHDGELHLAQVGDVWYYSSDSDHLIAALGCNANIYKIKEGETWGFTCVEGKIVPEECEIFTSRTTKYSKYTTDYTTDYTYEDSGWEPAEHTGTTNKFDTTNGIPVHDWDADWRTAWDDYCTETEHASS